VDLKEGWLIIGSSHFTVYPVIQACEIAASQNVGSGIPTITPPAPFASALQTSSGGYSEKRLPIGKQSMLNSPDQQRHKVFLYFGALNSLVRFSASKQVIPFPWFS